MFVIILFILFCITNSMISAIDSSIISRDAYVLPSENILAKTGLIRGNSQDRQHLGIYMPAGSSFMIRSVDGTIFQIDLLNNDRQTEKSGNSAYRVGSDWVKIEAPVDSIPFFRTNYGSYDKLTYEIKDRDNTQDITVFTKGGNESQFFSKWNSNNQQFAVIEGDRVNFLVPREDKDRIIGNGEYGFSTIDEMLNWYDGVIDNYDSYVGLSKNAANPYDENYQYKFFIKADINGPGGASYRKYYYITHKGTSLEGFLRRSWGALHEIGHGYDHAYIYDVKSLNLYEVGNNFYAYFEQLKYLNPGDGGFMWTNYTQEDLMKEIEKVSNYNDLVTENEYHFYERLFVFTNLFEKIGMEKAMAKSSSEYRRIKNEEGEIETVDLYGTYFSEATGYNVIPYFNTMKIFPNSISEDKIYPKKLPMVYPLAYIVNKNTATTIANNLNLRGIYSVVENNDIKNYITTNTITRNVKFKINTDDARKLFNKTIYIKNSSHEIIKEQRIVGNEVTITNVPVGIYYINISKGEVTNLKYLVVKQDSSVLSTNVNYDTNVIDVVDNDNEMDVKVDYNYDPKNINELGERVRVPNTGKMSNIVLIIFGSLIILLGILICIYYIIKYKKLYKQ